MLEGREFLLGLISKMRGLVQEASYLAGNTGFQILDCFICVIKELCACACVCVCMCVCVCLLTNSNMRALSPFIQI